MSRREAKEGGKNGGEGGTNEKKLVVVVVAAVVWLCVCARCIAAVVFCVVPVGIQLCCGLVVVRPSIYIYFFFWSYTNHYLPSPIVNIVGGNWTGANCRPCECVECRSSVTPAPF